ncbi:MAG: 50S ribosomal protein L21 [Lentisphaeria bacterium]
MYAIIKASGKQYKVEPGKKIELDRVAGEPGEVIDLNEVLFFSNDGKATIGDPVIAGACVKAEVVEHFRGPKLIVFKMKRRKRSRVKKGHRQEMTRLKVTDIVLG